jgi:hypothetical protein
VKIDRDYRIRIHTGHRRPDNRPERPENRNTYV